MKQTCPKCRSELSPTNQYCAVCGTLNSAFQEPSNKSFETPSNFFLEQIRQRDDFNNLFAPPLTECSIVLNKENFDYYQLALNIRKMVLTSLSVFFIQIIYFPILLPFSLNFLSPFWFIFIIFSFTILFLRILFAIFFIRACQNKGSSKWFSYFKGILGFCFPILAMIEFQTSCIKFYKKAGYKPGFAWPDLNQFTLFQQPG